MLAFLVSIFYSVPVLALDFKSFVVISEMTPQDLVSEFESLTNTSYPLQIVQFSNLLLPALLEFQPHFIFDFTNSLKDTNTLRNFAIQNKILYFSREVSSEFLHEWVFFLHAPPSSEAHAIQDFLKYLNLSEYHLASSESSRSKTIFSILSSETYNILSNSADQEVFDLYNSRVVKASGKWKLVCLGEERAAAKMLIGFEKIKMLRERGVFVVSSRGWKGVRALGAIGIVEQNLEQAQSEAQYEFQAVIRAIDVLKNLTQDLKGSFVTNDFLRKRLQEHTENNVVSEAFSIVNFKGEPRTVGKISNKQVDMWEEIVFPGNVTYINNSPPIVLLSANTGAVEYNGDIATGVPFISLGLQPMVYLVNNDPSVLPNYQLQLQETDCGFQLFQYEYTSNCMKKYFDKIGIAHIASTNGTAMILYRELFKEYNITVPHITVGYNNATLYDKDLHPDVIVNIPHILYIYILLPYVIKSFRWNNIILLFNPHIDPSHASGFIDNAKILNINILNPKDKMYVPFYKTKNYYNEVKPILEFIHKSKCRIIALMADPNSHMYFIEALYDFGYRRGELVLIFLTPVSYVIDYHKEYGFDRNKTVELIDGSLAIDFAEYTGEYGEEIEKQIAAIVYPYPTTYSCYRVDSLMLVARTADLMIRSGKDYEDFDGLMHFMRGIRFAGCTGMVSIDSGGNGLSDIIYTLHNFYVSDGEEIENKAGLYTFGVTVPLVISKTIVWPNGQTQIPKDLIQDTKCGFSDDLITSNSTSQKYSAIVSAVLLIVVLVLVILVWKMLRAFNIEYLTEKREIMFEDGVMMYSPIVESIQFISLGPDFYNANFVLGYVSYFASLNLDKVIYFEFDDFWTGIRVVLFVSGLWCFSFFFTLKFREMNMPVFIADFFEVVGIKLIQVFSGVGFIAINVLLFKVLDCKDGIGNEATDSFLYNDCRTFCWTGSHLVYVATTCAVLLSFNVMSILSRTVYDMCMDYVSIKMFRFYAFVKGIFQLGLVVLSLNLKTQYPLIFSGVYCVVFVCWTLFVFHVECYNYERLNHWVRVFAAGVCAHEVLMVFYTVLGMPSVVLIVLQISIVCACAGVGIYFQVKKFPSMLFRRKGRNFQKLLDFTFSGRVKAAELTLHKLDYVNKRE